MEKMKGKQACLFMWATVAALLTQNLVIPVMSTAIFEDQKNFFYYPPDPHVGGTPPTGSQPSPSHGSGGSSHGSTDPSHGTPSHGGGNHGGTPPANCGNPPSGGHHNPTPAPPKRSGSGGYYHNPPSTPSRPSTPHTPSRPSTPSTPTIVSPPTTPSIPGISVPSPPFDPNSPFTGTCNFWRTHPGYIFGLFGWWGTVGGTFGVASVHGFGSHMSLLEALSNTRHDGLGALYREGTASLLNSMVNKKFPYTTKQVRDSFIAALSSNKAAAAQAQLFELANEGKLTPRA